MAQCKNVSVSLLVPEGPSYDKDKFIQCAQQFQNWKWVHTVQTAPDDLGKYKGYENPTSRGEQKHWDEVGLCKCADLVVPVGPKLMKAYFSYLV